MKKEEIFELMKEMFACRSNSTIKRIGNIFKQNNINIKDLNTRFVIYNNEERIIVPTLGKGLDRVIKWNKAKTQKID